MTGLPDAPNINYCWAGLLVEELVRLEVAGFVLSPGSRNAPLSVSVARHPAARHWVHFDERGAGFFALGLAKQSGRPAVLISTSGSATANYWPAVVEAHASQIPLVIVTADRPPELLDCGANQAIDQPRLFGRYVRWDATLPCPDAAIDPAYVLTTVDQAVQQSLANGGGPVHLNCAFREPLSPEPDGSIPDGYLDGLSGWLYGNIPYTRTSPGMVSLDERLGEELLAAVLECTRGLLVLGSLHGPEETAQAAALARALGWPVFADICSGLRGYPELPGLMDYGDLVFLDSALSDDWQPDLVIHLGGAVTSKRFQQAMERWRPQYVRVHRRAARKDPGHLVRVHVPMCPGDFCAWLEAHMGNESTSSAPPRSWIQRNAHCGTTLREWEDEQEVLSDILVARTITRETPPHSLLFLGNSLPVRLADSFGRPNAPDIVVAANRGASGIDGNIATAAGMAIAMERPAAAILGDLTVLHDLNSLDLLRHVRTPFALVVLNNDGGGIFHHLPIADQRDVFEACFGTPHGLTLAAAATLFKVPYHNPDTIEDFRELFAAAMRIAGPVVIEVTLDRYACHALHLALRERLQDAMHFPDRGAIAP